MPDRSEPLQDEDAYWRSCREFVRLLITELNRALKASRVSLKKHKQICTAFAFGFCNFLDRQWFKPGGRTQYPLLCFARSFFDVDAAVDLSLVNFPHKSVELHGMVHDEVAWFFDEMKERDSAVPSGDVGAETEDVDLIEANAVGLIPQPCPTCRGTGRCFCLRRAGDPAGCPRCAGSGRCRHCGGSGKWTHA